MYHLLKCINRYYIINCCRKFKRKIIETAFFKRKKMRLPFHKGMCLIKMSYRTNELHHVKQID
jgi:hypothetical protein